MPSRYIVFAIIYAARLCRLSIIMLRRCCVDDIAFIYLLIRCHIDILLYAFDMLMLSYSLCCSCCRH